MLTGTATLASDVQGIAANQRYLAKYRDAIAAIGQTPERLAEEFSLAYRIRPERVRGW